MYRLTLHPLAKCPGPLFSKISSLSIPRQAASGDRHLHLLQEHRKYGPVIRIGPNALSFAAPSALRSIYQSSRLNNPLQKSEYYKTVDAPTGSYSSFTEISQKQHAFRRRVLDHAFSDAAMRSAETFVLQNVDTLCELLPSHLSPDQWSTPRDMSKYSTYFAYDVMGDLVFGKRFDCMTSDEHRHVPELITSSSYMLNWVAHLPLQFIVRPILCSATLINWIGGEQAKAEHEFVSYASECVRERMSKEHGESKQGRKDMMHYILNARDAETGQGFTSQQLDAEATLLISAGSDTTSTTLSAAYFYLTLPSSAEILGYLQRDLRRRFGSRADITWSSIKQHTYLRAVIDEALRLAPAAPSELPRTIVQQPGIEIAGQFIPTGVTVGCAAYVLHHDEEAFPDSFAFKPERWIAAPLNKDSADQTSTHLRDISDLQHPDQIARAREAFCPFSLGSRGCTGKNLAYMELSLALAHVLWEFEIRRAANSDVVTIRAEKDAKAKGLVWRPDEYQLKDVFITDRAGPMIEFKRHIA